MPPKKKGAGAPSKKNAAKAKEKMIEDKTFGLKNKKGAKQQKFIAKVQAQHSNKKQDPDKKARQLAASKEKAMMNALFKPVRPKIKPVEKKPQNNGKAEAEDGKRNLFVDARDKDKDETSAGWDQNQLEDVVKQKHGKQKVHPTTSKVCKHFLEAVEKGLYGWFWVCPNGGEACKYRHALPEGYVLKRDKKKQQEEEETISMEDLIDHERAALAEKTNQTPVTFETFMKWKKKKIAEKKKRLAQEQKKKKKEFDSGKSFGVTGREYFSYRPDAAGDDDAEASTTSYAREPPAEAAAASADGEEAKSTKIFDVSVFTSVDYGDMDEGDDDAEDGAGTEPKRAKFEVDFNGVAIDAGLFANLDDFDNVQLDDVASQAEAIVDATELTKGASTSASEA
eukprot:TRINITY_DN7684_c0_g1_i3.p1 TRINITY_DN7684_c0_g1~~TRINITY_DN7684_c0_g1_i3.p1  ORF type:complete len:395 (+),score=138.33 TRINITY_DN7684_c0_g1_i3:59-1243(+)